MADRDRGTTLVEAVITIMLLGLVSVVIAFAITTVIRVTPTTETSVDDARSLQGLSGQWPIDVASTPAMATNIDIAPSALTCDGSEDAAGTNLVELTWTVDESSPVNVAIAYRLEAESTGEIVRRYECSDATGPFDDTARATLTGPLANVGTVTATLSGPEPVVALELQTLDGDPIEIEATPRSPLGALPSTTTSPTVPPADCVVIFDAPSYGPLARIPWPDPLEDELAAAVVLTMSVTGSMCGALTVEYHTGLESKSRPIVVSGSSGSVTIPQGDSTADTPRWDDGNHVIEVYENGAPLGLSTTAELEVLP